MEHGLRKGRRMASVGQKRECLSFLLILILFRTFSTRVLLADDEPKSVPAGDAQVTKKSAPQEQQPRALPARFDPPFPSSEYLGPTPLIGVPDTDPEYPLEKALWSAFPALKRSMIKVYGWVNPGFDIS